jgi:catechol 2,3-dioxygenase
MGKNEAEHLKVRLAPRRLGHANIFVSDLERSSGFYSAVCGIRDVFREPGIMAAFHSNGNSHHDSAVMQVDDKPRVGRDGHGQVSSGRGSAPGLNHLGFEMENERTLVAAWERAKAQGLAMRTTDHGMSHSIYVFDPEGNYLEFYADMIDDWRDFYAGKENQLITGDWSPDPNSADDARRYTTAFVPDVLPEAASHPRRLSRATLLADDLPRMTAWYRDVAGLDLVAGGGANDNAVFAGAAAEPAVALFARGGDPKGLHHLSFELAGEAAVDETAANLQALGIPLVTRIDNAWKRSLVIADPDGNKLEFYAPRPGRMPDPESLPAEHRRYLI